LFSLKTTLSVILIHFSPICTSPTFSPHYPSLLHTQHLFNSLLCQLYTTPGLCNH
jgi:hypothetical protein